MIVDSGPHLKSHSSVDPSFPWSKEKLAQHILEAASAKASTRGFAHHMAKASIERWLAFELAEELEIDAHLPNGWATVVEKGATKGIGNIDILIVPEAATRPEKRLCPNTDVWHPGTIAIELKAVHLGDGEAGYGNALVGDLTTKPPRATAVGRKCALWLGFLVTTDGCWSGTVSSNKMAGRAALLNKGMLPIASGVRRVGEPVVHELRYRSWTGNVWFEVFEAVDVVL